MKDGRMNGRVVADELVTQAAHDEQYVAESMCLPIVINDVDVGAALIDQGASRSVMRNTAYIKMRKRMNGENTRLRKIFNMYVVGSTGEYIPIIGRFLATLRTDGVMIGTSLIYVMDDTKEKDIICDLVIGRSTIATSPYSYIDTKDTGALVCMSGDPEKDIMRLPCSRCKLIRDEDGRSQLKIDNSEGRKVLEKEVAVNTMKVLKLESLVNDRSYLTSEAKQHLLSYLIKHVDEFDIDESKIEAMNNKREEMINNSDEIVRVCHLMSALGKSIPNSGEESIIISELLSTYVPDVVQKSTTIRQRKKEVSDESNTVRDETDEVDEIEFPFIPPTTKDDSPEYHAAKEVALRELIAKNHHLDDKQREQLVSVLLEHADRFSMKGENMERTDSVEHEIDTTNKRPFRERLRQYAPAVQQIIDGEVQEMLKQGVIVPSKSAYASNLLLVRKPDPSSEGGMKNRVCASFVQLNAQTEKDSYPLPNIQYIFDRIGKSRWFTTMDLLSGFWQVMIKPEHRHKTAFITMRGLYEFVVMPFGLCNAPATFQRLMDAVILPEYREFIETYIDDLMTHSSSFEDHLKHLDILLSSLRKHKLVVKLSKCKFAQKEVKFLGHVISCNQIKTNPEAVAAISNWSRPMGEGKKAVTAVRGFLGMAGWYRKFIPHFADITKPLVHLTKNEVKWEWTKECQTAFEKIRDALTQTPVLAVADPNKSYILHTDASDHAMGAVLSQTDEDNRLHPIAYASKTFTDAQKNYDTTEREALAIIWALNHFNTYCEGHKYTLITDHKALEYIKTNKDVKKRIHRWAVLLQAYQVDIYYKPGKQNFAADLLSRPLMEPITTLTVNTMKTGQRKRRVRFQDEYEVERIVDKRMSEKKEGDWEYLVKWKNYPESENTWEPVHHLQNATDKLTEYERLHKYEEHESVPSTLEESPTICIDCQKEFNNESALHVHRYHEHYVQVPTDRLRKLEMNTNPEVFKKLQESEPDFRVIYTSELGTLDLQHSSTQERRMLMNNEFVLSDAGLLYCIEQSSVRSRSKLRTQLRLCIPRTERKRILYEYHDRHAHPGIVHLYDQLRENVWWPRMLSHVIDYVRQCDTCRRSKGEREKFLPRPVDVPAGPWSHLAIDHAGPFPTSNNGMKYILVIIDRFTRYVEAFPVEDTTAITTARVIIDKIICRYGFMLVIQSDRGRGFVSTVLNQIFKLLNVRRVKTTAYHPRANGVVEVSNRTLKTILRMFVNEHHTDWDELLPFALFSYNTSFHSLVKETPYYLNHGRQARTIVDQVTEEDIRNSQDTHAYAYEIVQRLYQVHQRVREIYAQVNEERKQDISCESVTTYHEGDLVLLYDPTTPIHRSRKLVKRWTGPYKVLVKHNAVNYTILREGAQQRVNADRLRRYDAGTESIMDKHASDIELAKEEIRVINETMNELNDRKSILLSEQQISAAGKEIEEQDKTDETTSHPTTQELPQEDNEETYDEDEQDEVEAVNVDVMFVSMWN
jgi:transposase InsO family protein